MELHGIYAATTTPFDHRGEIYWMKFDHNLAQLRRTTLSGVVVTGKWGEGPLLSAAERAAIWKRAVENADETQVLATVADSGVRVARESLQLAAEAGCHGAIVEAPDLRGLAPGTEPASLFYRSVADTAELPVLVAANRLGSGDAMTGNLASLAKHPRIAGAVVAGCSADRVSATVNACGPGFAIAVQGLERAAECLAAGASAAVLSVAAAVPFYALSVEEAVRTREFEAAKALVKRGLDFESLLREHGVAALKCALDLRSYYGGIPRLPLLGLSPRDSASLSRSLEELAS